MKVRLHSICALFSVLLTCFLLISCGGGGGGNNASEPTVVAPATSTTEQDCNKIINGCEFSTINILSITPELVIPTSVTTLNGSGFSNLDHLTIDDVQLTANQYTVLNDHQIEIQISEQPAGTHKLTATAKDGQANFINFDVAQQLKNVRHIAYGENRICSLSENGSVSCWGYSTRSFTNNGGEPIPYSSNIPVQIPGISDAIQISVSDWFACALRTNHTVACWYEFEPASNDPTELNFIYHDIATPISGLVNAEEIVAADAYHCARTSDGNVYCWGGRFGGLGDGITTQSATPIRVSALSNIKKLYGGKQGLCAVDISNNVFCWKDRDASPTPEPSLNSSAALMQNSKCAKSSSGEFFCWDFYDSGTAKRYSQPVYITNLSDAVDVAYFGGNWCVLKTNNQVTCYGGLQFSDEQHAQLSFPSGIDDHNATDIVEIAAGAYSICTLNSDKTVACTGNALAGSNVSTTPKNSVALSNGALMSAYKPKMAELGVLVKTTMAN